MKSHDNAYVGGELELFAGAHNWKTYLGGILRPYLHGRVLEVGAGIGGTTSFLCHEGCAAWTCLEPDARLVAEMQEKKTVGSLPPQCAVALGTVANLTPGSQYDSVVYIDVLEHIEDDRGELNAVSPFVAAGGHLIVMSPAHQFLYSAFDRAVGHHRRYARAGLQALMPPAFRPERLAYIDSVGLLASFANRVLLRSAQPSVAQIQLWDRFMIPLARVLDPLVRGRIGKSVIAVWRKKT